MADDYGTCPNDVFEDPRLEDVPLALVSGFVLVMNVADDHMLFEGRPRTFARRFGGAADEVQELFDALEDRGLVRFYDAPVDGGTRRVGEVVGGHRFRGHPDRVAQPSQRGASLFPLEDGTFVAGRRERKRAGGVQELSSKRAAPVQPKTDERAGGVQELSSKRAAARTRANKETRARPISTAQHSTAQISPPNGGERSVHDAASANERDRRPTPDGVGDTLDVASVDSNTSETPVRKPWEVPERCKCGATFVSGLERHRKCEQCRERQVDTQLEPAPPPPTPLPDGLDAEEAELVLAAQAKVARLREDRAEQRRLGVA